MGTKVEYIESSHLYATNYVRNSKAIGVLWAIFTICYAIISVVAFVTPEWIGDLQSEYPGRFGLWSSCQTEESGEQCIGRLDDLTTIPSTIFQIATIFVGISVIIALLTICAMLLFFFCRSTTVFHICGWMQLLSAICLTVGVVSYPAGWDAPEVRRTCGPTADRYVLGLCGLRWAYSLAVIGCLDAVILSTLAFILATRHVRLQAEPAYPPSSMFKGEVNNAYVTDAASVAGSRKSLNLHPVLLVAPPHHLDDTYSQFSSRTARSQHYRPEQAYAHSSSMHNFQL